MQLEPLSVTRSLGFLEKECESWEGFLGWRCCGVSRSAAMLCPSRAAPKSRGGSAGMRLGNPSPGSLGDPGGLSSNPVCLAELAEPSLPPPRQIPALPPAEPRPLARPAVPKKEKRLEDEKSPAVLTKPPRAELCGAPEAVTCECFPDASSDTGQRWEPGSSWLCSSPHQSSKRA